MAAASFTTVPAVALSNIMTATIYDHCQYAYKGKWCALLVTLTLLFAFILT